MIGQNGKITFETPQTRIYRFPNYQSVVIEDVIELIVRPSGDHRLKSKNGMHYIVPPGWLCIEIDIKDWTI